MRYVPEVSPLLDRSRYTTTISFILPLVINKLRKPEDDFEYEISVQAYASGNPQPFNISKRFSQAQGNKNYSYTINDDLEKAGLPPKAPAFMTIHGNNITSARLPSVLKVIGHWVSFANDSVYGALPSNVLFSSSRLEYGGEFDARLVDYFSITRTTHFADNLIILINPYIKASWSDISLFGNTNKLVKKHTQQLPAFSIHAISVHEMLGGARDFTGYTTLLSPHRVVSYCAHKNTKNGMIYAADHSMPWINKVIK